MESRSKYLLKNTSIFAIGSMGAKLINFFLVPFYTYVLTTEEYGTVDLIFTIATVVIPLVMFNIGEAIMRYALDEDADHEKILSIAVCAIGFGIIVSLVLLPVSAQFEIISNYSVYIYLYVVLSAAKMVVTSYLRGKEQLKLYVSCNLLNTFLIAILNIFFLVGLNKGIEGYLSAYILAEVIAIVFAIIAGRIYKDVRHFSIDTKLAKKMIGFSLAVIPNSLLWWVINSSDRIMVTAMSSIAENGVLAVSYKLPSLLTMMNSILMQAWKYSAIKERNSEDKDEFTNSMLKQFLKGTVLIAASMLLVIKPFTKILFSESYYASWKPSVFLLVGFVFMGIGTFVGTIYYVEKNMMGNMLSALAGAIVNVILNAVLIPKMGAAGATLAACVSYCVILLYRYFDTKKYQKIDLFNKEYIVLFIMLFIMAAGIVTDNMVGVLVECSAYIVILLLNLKYISGILKNVFKGGRALVSRK